MSSKQQFKISLKFTLIFFIAAIIISSSLIVITLNWKLNISESRKNIIKNQKIHSLQIRKYLNYNFTTIEKTVSLLTSFIKHIQNDSNRLEAIKSILNTVATQETLFSTISFADIDNNYTSVFRVNKEKNLLLATADSTGVLISDFFDINKQGKNSRTTEGFFAASRIWFTQAISSQKLEWTPIYEHYSSGSYGIAASQAVIKNDKPIGVVAIDYTLEHLSKMLIALKKQTPGIIVLIDKSNKIIAKSISDNSNDQNLLQKVSHNNFSLLNNSKYKDKNSYIYDGFIVQKSQIVLNKNDKYFLVDVVEESVLLADLNQTIKKQAWIALFIIFSIMLLSYFLLLYILKPIKKLEDSSKIIHSGEWDINLPKSLFTEINNLSSAYSMMASKIQKSLQTLESQVKQRTENLNLLNKQLNKQALTDSLTQLSNRRNYKQMFEKSWENNSKLSLALIDIDFFKLYNDTYGHVAGDKCLKKIGKLFNSASVDKRINFFRIGGEEFAILFIDYPIETIKDMIFTLMGKLDQLKIEHRKSPINSFITLSIGVAERTNSHESWEDLYKSTDRLLYHAKQNGKNRLSVTE